jgi:restriction system protein
MAVPDFQSFFKPLLELAGDGKEHSVREAREIIAKNMTLSEADLSELLPSGTQTKFDNRVAWAKSYFVQAKVLESTRRGYFRITDRGRELLAKGHPRIDIRILDQYSEFVEFHSANRDTESQSLSEVAPTQTETPE